MYINTVVYNSKVSVSLIQNNICKNIVNDKLLWICKVKNIFNLKENKTSYKFLKNIDQYISV